MQLRTSVFYEYKNAILLGVGCVFWCLMVQWVAGALSFVAGLLLFLAGVPIFYSYLSFGQRHGLVSSVVATVIIVLVMPFRASCDMLLDIVVPSAFVGYLSMERIVKKRKVWWYPEQFVVENMVILASVVLVITSLTLRTEDALMHVYEESLKVISAENTPQTSVVTVVLKSLIRYYNGIAILFNMFNILICRYIAYNLGKRFKNVLRAPFEIAEISISGWYGIFPLISFTLSKLLPSMSYIFSGLFVVTLFAPAIAGLSVLYFVAKKRHFNKFSLVALLLLCFFPFHTIFFAALVGAFDSFFSIRASFSKKLR